MLLFPHCPTTQVRVPKAGQWLRNIRTLRGRLVSMLAIGSMWEARYRCKTCRVFRESIVVLLEPVDLEEVVVSAG